MQLLGDAYAVCGDAVDGTKADADIRDGCKLGACVLVFGLRTGERGVVDLSLRVGCPKRSTLVYCAPICGNAVTISLQRGLSCNPCCSWFWRISRMRACILGSMFISTLSACSRGSVVLTVPSPSIVNGSRSSSSAPGTDGMAWYGCVWRMFVLMTSVRCERGSVCSS